MDQQTIYPRRLETRLLEEMGSQKIVVLTGMRQTGKTTLMRKIFNSVKSDNKVFLDLENPLNQKVFEEENFDNILRNLKAVNIDPAGKCCIFLDEIQLMPEISKAVKYLFDRYKIKFFLTGSSSFYLKNLFSESLSGRKAVYELFPLDFEEFLIFKESAREPCSSLSEAAAKKNKISYGLKGGLFKEYLEFGGFPGVVSEKPGKTKTLGDIFTSYFEKDVKSLADFREINKLRDIVLLLANRVGSKIDITKISSEIGISRETVYSYLNFLEKTYFIFLVPPFSGSLNGEVRGAKKVYFCDIGLLNYLGKISEGAVFENAVFNNLRKYGKINYYQKHKGPEIDFILEEKIALEIKMHGDTSDIVKLSRHAVNLKIKEHYLVTGNFFDHPRAIPAQDL